MASPRADRESRPWTAFTASITFSPSPVIFRLDSRFTTATPSSCSMMRMFSSNRPNRLTASSIRSMLMFCSVMKCTSFVFRMKRSFCFSPRCSRRFSASLLSRFACSRRAASLRLRQNPVPLRGPWAFAFAALHPRCSRRLSASSSQPAPPAPRCGRSPPGTPPAGSR